MSKDVSGYIFHKVLRYPVRLHVAYDKRSDDEKYTIIFLHGIAATSKTWRETIRDFNKTDIFDNCRLITLDLLGFGGSMSSDWLNYDYKDYCSALKNTIKKLHIKTPIILVGHSMGSLISAKYAEKFPKNISHLMLVSPPVILPTELQKLPDKFYTHSFKNIYPNAGNNSFKKFANAIQKFSNFRAKYLDTTAFDQSMQNIILNDNNYDTFCDIKIPTTIIHGLLDPLVMGTNLTKIAKSNANVNLITCRLSHHDITQAKREKLISEFRRIFDETL